MEVLDDVLREAKGGVVLSDYFQEVAVAADFLFVTGAETLRVHACQHLSDLLVAQLRSLDPGGRGSRLDRRDHPEAIDLLRRLRFQSEPPSGKAIQPSDQTEELPPVPDVNQGGVGKRPWSLRLQDCHNAAIILPLGNWQRIGNRVASTDGTPLGRRPRFPVPVDQRSECRLDHLW